MPRTALIVFVECDEAGHRVPAITLHGIPRVKTMAVLKLKTKPSTPIVTSSITVRRREVPVSCQPVAEPELPTIPAPPKAAKPPRAPRKIKSPPPTPEELAAARKARQENVQQIIAEIMRRWPLLFPVTETDLTRPWAIGISKQIHGILLQEGIACSRNRLSQAIALYRDRPEVKEKYWQLLQAGGPRYGLDGNEQGEITEKQRQKAIKKVGLE